MDDSFYKDRLFREQLVTEGFRQDAAKELMRPSMILRPGLSIDGNKWCALFGDNLQDGVAGFGDSPAEAYEDFDRNWAAKLPTAQRGRDER